MKHGFLLLSLLAVSLLAGACQNGGPAGIEPTSKVGPAMGAVRLPWKGQFAGTTVITGPCADGAGILAEVTGSGYATHVGKATVAMTVCTDPVTQAPLQPFVHTTTAANGSLILSMMIGGWIDETSGETVSQWVITGGTGLFSNAQGEFTNRGIHNPDLSWSTRSEGWISFGLR